MWDTWEDLYAAMSTVSDQAMSRDDVPMYSVYVPLAKAQSPRSSDQCYKSLRASSVNATAFVSPDLTKIFSRPLSSFGGSRASRGYPTYS